MAKVLMVQGTMSNVGKSLVTAGLCRVFRQDGYKVAPFKSQNMALNSFITADGLEMGRAQVMQAEAAGIEPDVRMNPILLKPTNDVGSQVIVNGEIRGTMSAADYFAYKHNLISFSVSSPNFGLARQAQDPWGGGCVTISGPENEEARAWYEKNQMPVIAYSSLGRGLFSGKMKSTDKDRVQDFLDSPAVKGYACEDNFERLKRCELLAEKYNVTVPQIAMSWIFAQPINTFAAASMSRNERMIKNVEAFNLEISTEEVAYLDLRC